MATTLESQQTAARQVGNHQVAPRPDEGYHRFVQRAHAELMDSIPDWDERNQAVWRAWEAVHGDPLRARACKYFDGYRFVPNVCYFSEHETIGSDGKPVRYTLQELLDIISEHNDRADKHNYPALVSKHTVDHDVPEEMEPKTVGYVGAARLGMLGNKNPHWAAFFDEHHSPDPDSQAILARKRRRSVEVNRYRDGRRSYFDPVAVLGAESPRLPLPVARYAEGHATIDRYSIVAPSMVAATNTFIPNTSGRSRNSSKEESMIAVEDVKKIVEAIQATPELQWVRQQMEAADSASGKPAAPEDGGGQEGEGQDARPAGAMGADADDEQDTEDMATARNRLPRYSAVSGDAAIRERYSQLLEANRRLIREVAATKTAVAELERREADKGRELQLRQLADLHPHFVDLDEELDRCLYSRGANLSDKEFAAHIADLERYAQRSSPASVMVPKGDLGAPATDKERYSQQVADAVVKLHERYSRKGVFKSYEELESEVLESIGGAK